MANTRSTAIENPPGARQNQEADLVARVVAGDTAAFGQLVALHQERVTRLVYRLLGWRAGVEDVVQDVFVAVLENVGRFRGESSLATWIYRITVSQCRRWRTRWALHWRRRRDVGLPRSVDSPIVEAALVERETGERVRAAVRELSRPYLEVVVLRYLEGLPMAEIGRILGLERNAVEVRLNRARERLRLTLAGFLEG